MSWFRIATSLFWNDTLDLLPTHLWSNFCHVLILTFLGCSQDVPHWYGWRDILKAKTRIDQHHMTPDASTFAVFTKKSCHRKPEFSLVFFAGNERFRQTLRDFPVWRWPGTIERCRVPSPKCRWGVWVAGFWVMILQSVGLFSSFSNHPGQRFMKSRELDETYCIQKRQDIFLDMLS